MAKKSKTISTKNMVKKVDHKMIIKVSHKSKMDDIHDFNTKVNRGNGVVDSKKKREKNFRTEKYKKNTRDFL